MPSCEVGDEAGRVYRAALDDATLRQRLEAAGVTVDELTTEPDPALDTPCVRLCVRCHPHLSTHPPVEAPPSGYPEHSAAYICGRAKGPGERCRSPVTVPWQACRFHRYASIM